MKIMNLLLAPWAIQPDRLVEIQDLYISHTRREKIDLKAWEAATGRPAGSDREPYRVQDGVAVLPLHGVMVKEDGAWNRLCGMTSTVLAKHDLQLALQDPAVHSIVLWVDSPGGLVDGTQELANAVFEARGVKPIVTLADGCMCSAACWVGTATERVFITSDTTATGSIGVVTAHMDVSRYEEALGRKTTEITAGKYKRIASQYAPLTEEGRATIQGQLDHIYGVFVDAIAQFRAASVDTVLSKMADGRVFLGRQGIEAGLVDGVSAMDDLIALLNQERLGKRPGAGVALPNQPTSKEARMPITREDLAAQEGGQDLITALIDEGKAQGSAAVKTETETLVTKAAEAATTAETARIKGIFEAAVGHDLTKGLAESLAFDGKTSVEAAKGQFLDDVKKRGPLTRIRTEAPPVVPFGGQPGSSEDDAEASLRERYESNSSLQNLYGSFEAFQKATEAADAAAKNGRIRTK